jgi:hypothetical protein
MQEGRLTSDEVMDFFVIDGVTLWRLTRLHYPEKGEALLYTRDEAAWLWHCVI